MRRPAGRSTTESARPSHHRDGQLLPITATLCQIAVQDVNRQWGIDGGARQRDAREGVGEMEPLQRIVQWNNIRHHRETGEDEKALDQ